MVTKFKQHKVTVDVFLNWSSYAYSVYEDEKEIAFDYGYASHELAWKAAFRELDYLFGNRWSLKY